MMGNITGLEKSMNEVNSTITAFGEHLERKLSVLSTTVAADVKAHSPPQMNEVQSTVNNLVAKVDTIEADFTDTIAKMEHV